MPSPEALPLAAAPMSSLTEPTLCELAAVVLPLAALAVADALRPLALAVALPKSSRRPRRPHR